MAQPSVPMPDRQTVGSTINADVLNDLPTAGNLFSALETMQAEAVADRFNSGGLNGGTPSHIVALLGSRNQTRYRIGDVDITGATAGTPLLFPDAAFWQRVDVATAMMPNELNVNGFAVSLAPLRPTPRWSGVVEAFGSSGQLIAPPSATRAPPIAQLDGWTRGSAVASGPIGSRTSLLVGASVTDSTTLHRQRESTREYARSAFSHFIVSPGTNSELRSIGWLQRTTNGTTVHLQSTYDRAKGAGPGWRLFGGYTQLVRAAASVSTVRVVDRLVDGPIPALLQPDDATERRWSLGARLPLAKRSHAALGGEYSSTAIRATHVADAIIAETVDGIPARVWWYTSPASASRREATTVSLFVSDRFKPSSKVDLDASLRFEAVRGRARGAAQGIDWYTLLPNIGVRWNLAHRFISAVFTSYRRSANQLTLDLIEHGDPAAPVGRVYRWDGPLENRSTLVARVGPGTADDPAFSAIDAHLRRPHTDEFVIGLNARLSQIWRMQIAGVARRESSLINLVNLGAPASSYRLFTIPDANADLVGTSDDQQLPVYDRLPESFGQDRYQLTNINQDAATTGAVVITARAQTSRLFMVIGATAAAVVGSGGNRGFRSYENDQDTIGEVLTNPNATTNARGRLFSDRAYTIKWTTVYKFPADIRLGLMARYQDGQPFSRMVVVSGLTQGAEAIQAFANGRSRFAFTGTLDMRLQKGIALGSGRLDVVLDVYNLLDMKKEVEESVVSGPRFRETTAVQPPRAAHVGLRMRF
jgi:hypothetical protein